MPFNWHQFYADENRAPAVVDPRRRLWICLAGFAVALLAVFGRTVQLELTQGAGFRAEALRPIEKQTVLPAPRGRILARDGAPLAYDQPLRAVAVDYRWLQDPPDGRWLRATARARLAKADRKNGQKLGSAEAAVLADHIDLAQRLAKLCGLSPQQWAAQTRQIQARVERIAAGANRRRQSMAASADDVEEGWAERIRRLLLEDPPPPPVTVAEELAHHVMADDVTAAVVSEINDHADRYPGTKIIELSRRTYPACMLAAHVLGYLGPVEEKELLTCSGRACPPCEAEDTAGKPARYTDVASDQLANDLAYKPDELVGRMGVERQYEAVLRGRPGVAVEQTDRGGHLLTSYRPEEPVAGHDVTLTLDAALQRTAEELLQGAKERGQNYSSGVKENSSDPFFSAAGGAIVVMDVRDGAIRAAAAMPTFDPNLFAHGKTEDRVGLLADKSHPLFDRVCSMALPPGSAFKVVTAVALLESASIDPEKAFFCQGYLHQPDRQRCQIYVRQGVGHGDVTLADALAVSCNVYFFHFAGLMGPRPLVAWADRFGFGRPTGVDLPGEVTGTLPSPENIKGGRRTFPSNAKPSGNSSPETSSVPVSWHTADTQSIAIGQGSLTATPLQMVRMMAAVANGGRLVTPHVVERGREAGDGRRELGIRDSGFGAGNEDDLPYPSPQPPTPSPLPLSARTLRIVRDGLRRVVADPNGTAHATVYLESIAIAGKTGTAETGEDRPSHAWFVGYVPADEPKLAFVIVLEHAGEAATAAGPLAKRLVLRMDQLGLL